ncbi:MAG: hypothetical protein AB7P14_11085 [Blastocatellales bacterium]
MNAHIKRIGMSLLITILMAGMALAQETEKRVTMKELPPAVQATVKEQSKGAKLRGLAMETENGRTYYEAELLVKGHSKDVTIAPDGKVVTIEEQVSLSTLPTAAKTEILKWAGKGKILLVESITENNLIVAYEAHFKKAGKVSEIKVSPDGKPME